MGLGLLGLEGGRDGGRGSFLTRMWSFWKRRVWEDNVTLGITACSVRNERLKGLLLD